MSTVEEGKAGTSVKVVPALTFKERLAERRKELESDSTFELPVEGYDDLWARYRVLGFEEVRGIGMAVEQETDDQVHAERLTAATTLAEACVELLERKEGRDEKGKPVFEALGYRWTPTAARELFEIDLPEGVVPRDALLAIFPYPRDLLLMNHFSRFLEAGMGYLPEIEKILQGESLAVSAPTTSAS